jgi:predicted metal-dependent hydrolase
MRQNRYWLGNDPVLTHFVNALQSTFPEGERFFIDSARDMAAEIGEEQLPPQLAADLKAFIRQEGWHGKQHEGWCEALVELGYLRMEEYGEALKRQRVWARKHLSPILRLAMTAAAEHMTASMVQLFLRTDMLDKADRLIAGLLAWHAMEETEHKSVCFDLYQVAGGGYIRRSLILLVEWFDLIIHTHNRHRYLLKADNLWNWHTRWRILRDIYGPRGIIGKMTWLMWRYLRPGFHPWDIDDRADFRQRYGHLLASLQL